MTVSLSINMPHDLSSALYAMPMRLSRHPCRGHKSGATASLSMDVRCHPLCNLSDRCSNICAAIHRAAGPTLRKFCMAMPLVTGTNSVRIPTGKAVATRSDDMSGVTVLQVTLIVRTFAPSAQGLCSGSNGCLDLCEIQRRMFRGSIPGHRSA